MTPQQAIGNPTFDTSWLIVSTHSILRPFRIAKGDGPGPKPRPATHYTSSRYVSLASAFAMAT